jgi:hypothetical protein
MGDAAIAPVAAVPEVGPGAAGTWDAAPTRILTGAQLLQLAVYWYGLVSVFNGVNVVIQERMPGLVEARWVGLASGLVQIAGVAIAVLVQPTIGTISDYTMSRWPAGRVPVRDRDLRDRRAAAPAGDGAARASRLTGLPATSG